MLNPNGLQPIQDGGIRWVFNFQELDVPARELAMIDHAEQEKFLRLAVTFGSHDRVAQEYRSTTMVHLWRMNLLPERISWRTVFVHVFTHEPLHHAIGRILAEIGERGNQEWAIRKLGDGRWW